MKTRVALALECFAIVAMCAASRTVLAYEGEDAASNYTNNWDFQNGGTGFDFWMTMDDLNASADLIGSAASYGGNAAAMDTAGKCFVLSLPGQPEPSRASLYVSRNITTTQADGMKFKIRMQCPVGIVALQLGRDSGRFGSIATSGPGWRIARGGGFTSIDLDSQAPVEVVVTTFGSSGKHA